MKKILFGIGLGGTGWTSGCEKAPNVIKSLIDRYCPDVYSIAEYKSIYFNPGISTENKLEQIYLKYSEISKKYDKILSLGGDHLISYPIVKCLFEKQKITYVYLDAHLDYYDDKPCFNWNVVKKISDLGVNVINIGFRSFLDEKISNEIKCIPIIGDFDSKEIVNKIQNIIAEDELIYLSVDLDILDPLVFPFVNSPVSCGLLPRDLFFIIKTLIEDYSIIGIDINEFNSQKDNQEMGNHLIRFLVDYILNEWR